MLGATEHLERYIFQLDAEFFGNQLTGAKDREVLKHGLAPVAKTRALCSLANTSCLEEIFIASVLPIFPCNRTWQLEQGWSAAYQSALPAIQNRVITIAGKPSFDCHKAKSETSQIICGHPNL